MSAWRRGAGSRYECVLIQRVGNRKRRKFMHHGNAPLLEEVIQNDFPDVWHEATEGSILPWPACLNQMLLEMAGK